MKQLQGWRGVYLNDTELETYIDIGFYQVETNFNFKDYAD
mgnify:CR=1 FL=1|jgi:hypothetical protein